MPTPDEPAATALRELKKLTGRRIARVIYREILYSDEPNGAFRSPDHHSLDYGLELHLESDAVVSFIWAIPNAEEALAVLPRDLPSELQGEHGIFDVTSDPEWATYVGCTILGADLRWYDSPDVEGSYVECVRLDFEGRESVFIALGEFTEPGAINSSDNVSVFFSPNSAARFGCSF